jgi:hypothetical protein
MTSLTLTLAELRRALDMQSVTEVPALRGPKMSPRIWLCSPFQ